LDQTINLRGAYLAQDLDTHVAVDQQVLSRRVFVPCDHGQFHKSDLDGRADLLVFGSFPGAFGEQVKRLDIFKPKANRIALESGFYVRNSRSHA
jgi:hypothetical protein